MEKNIEDIKTLPVVETLNRIIQEYYSFMAWAHYTNLEDNEETVVIS